jgi:hypothetical protein
MVDQTIGNGAWGARHAANLRQSPLLDKRENSSDTFVLTFVLLLCPPDPVSPRRILHLPSKVVGHNDYDENHNAHEAENDSRNSGSFARERA